MRPLKGVVVEVIGQTLVIELESGMIIKWPKVHGLRTGNRALVTYDFTTNKPKYVLPHVDNARENEVNVAEPIKTDTPDEDDDSDILVEDSGALRPFCDGWEFWSPDSGILEL